MESVNLNLISSPESKLLVHCSPTSATKDVFRSNPFSLRRTVILPLCSRYCPSRSHVVKAAAKSHQNPKAVQERFKVDHFASIFSSSSQQTSSIGVKPQLSVPPPASTIGSPLFWIGVGVGLSALFSLLATRLKKYAMQQAFKTMTGQTNPQSTQFNVAVFSSGSSYPSATFPSAPQSPAPSVPGVSQSAVMVDKSVTKTEASTATDVKGEVEVKNEPKKIGIYELHGQREPYVLSGWTAERKINLISGSFGENDGRSNSAEDGMMQNPQCRQQLEEMLNNMSGSSEWNSRMMDALRNFDLNNPGVKQHFGLTPKEVISKIMTNPDVAMAFQNPRVQAAIMDCSQNPLNMAKYQHDKEVMDVFNKISKLFPEMTG